MAKALPIPVGARVGILTGVQAVGGPYVGDVGTVIAHREVWKDSPEYLVAVDGDHIAPLLYRPYLIVEV